MLTGALLPCRLKVLCCVDRWFISCVDRVVLFVVSAECISIRCRPTLGFCKYQVINSL